MKKKNKIVLFVVLAVIVVAAGAIYIVKKRQSKAAATSADKQAGAEVASVVLSQAREMVFQELIQVSGNVEAKNTALVSARIPGTLDDVFVDEGDSVEAGQKLFQTDKVTLTQAFESAQKQVAVAAASVELREATIVGIDANLAKVQLDYDRYKRLYEQDHAVTKNVFELQDSQLKQVKAGLDEAKAGLKLARAQEQQAQSALAIAQKDLNDSLVVSPIKGKVSKRMLDPGEMAGAGTPVLRVDDLSVIEITAYLPEAYYSRVVEGKTAMRAKVQGVDMKDVVITTKSPTINQRLRTFEVKALVRNPPAGVVPGARAELAVVLQTRTALGVPRTAVVQRGKGLAIFTVRDGKAHMLIAETGLESDGWVEVRADGLVKDMPVVHMGQDRLNEGSAVAEVKEDAK